MRVRVVLILAGLAAVMVIAVVLVRAVSRDSGDAAPAAEAAAGGDRSGGGAQPVLGAGDTHDKPPLDCARPSGAAARVGDGSIAVEQLCTWLLKVGAVTAGKVDTAQAKRALDRMIDAALVRQALQQAGVHVDDAEVTAMLAQLGVSAGSAWGDPAQDPVLLREQARERLELEKLAAQRTSITVEEAEVDRELAAGAPGIDRGQGVRVDGWVARVPPSADAATSARAEKAASEFANALPAEKPDGLARSYGLTRVPPFLLSDSGLEPELETAAFSLPRGAYSRAIKTRAGWTVIRALERVEGTKLDDKQLRIRVRRALETRRRQAASRQLLDELRSKTPVEILVEL